MMVAQDKRISIDAEYVRRRFLFDANTGRLVWRDGNWKGREVGETHFGYRRVKIQGKNYRVHRLIWLYVHGHWPKEFLDHVNGDRGDNRLCNLRECDHTQNMANRRPQGGRKLKGITKFRGKQWIAQIRHGGRSRYIGVFDTPEEANAAYLAKARELKGEFAWRPE